MNPGRWRRIRIFIAGIFVNIVIVGAFFMLAWLLNDAAEYAWIGRVLAGLFVVLNPLLSIVQRVVLRVLPAPAAAGRLGVKLAFVATFLGWWWLVAVVVDRLLSRRRLDQGAD